jgi:hypothetical protein
MLIFHYFREKSLTASPAGGDTPEDNLLTDTPVTVFILNNNMEVFNRTQQDLQAWGVDTESWLRLILLLGFVLITSFSLGYGV